MSREVKVRVEFSFKRFVYFFGGGGGTGGFLDNQAVYM